MIAAFVRKNLQATIERLNRREIFSCEFYQARNMDAAKKSVEDGGSFSHIIFDIAYFDGDIDAGLELLSRFSATTTAIMIVVNDDVNFGLAVKQEALKRGVKPSNIISGTGAAFGKALLEILIRDHVVIDDATSVPEDIPTVSETTLVASEFPGPVTALPASAKDNVSIAVAGAGAGVGCTTQAMQILLYLRSQSVDAALVEMVSRHSLSEYDGIMEDENYEIVDEIHIRVCGSDIYLGSQSVTKARAQHSYLVYDYGNYEGIPDVSTYLEKDIRVVVGSTKPWEMGHLNGVLRQTMARFIMYLLLYLREISKLSVCRWPMLPVRHFFQAMLPITLIFVAMKICIAVLSAMFRLLLLHPVLIKNVGSYLNDRGAT